MRSPWLIGSLSVFFLLITKSYCATSGEELAEFRKEINAGIGTVKLSYRIPGEPISKPATLELSVLCTDAEGDFKIEDLSMCALKDYHFESKVKLLTVRFSIGRVDEGGKVHCDQTDEREFNIKKICNHARQKH
jgi:hypothetical protein